MPENCALSSPGRRLGGYLLEFLLLSVTLGIGWLIWSFVVWGRGQTPAKQVLKMRVVALDQGRSASWGRMFLREFIAKPVIGVFSWLTVGIANFWLVWDKQNQELWDKVVGTVVVTDRARALLEKKTYPIGGARSGQLRTAGVDALPFPPPPQLEQPQVPEREAPELPPIDTSDQGE